VSGRSTSARCTPPSIVSNATDSWRCATYAITVDGVAALGEWWEAVPADDPPPRDELMLKVLMAIERGDDHALRVITHQRTVLLTLLQGKRKVRRAAADETLAARLVTDALVARAEADLRWLDTCEEHLQRRAASATSAGSATSNTSINTSINTSTRKAPR
jgi:hypothetical protein